MDKVLGSKTLEKKEVQDQPSEQRQQETSRLTNWQTEGRK